MGLGRSLALPGPTDGHHADWERRNRAIADCGGRGRLGEAPGRFGARVGDRAVRGRVRSRDGNWMRTSSLMFAYIRLIGKNIESTACGQRCARPLSGMGNARKPQRTQRTQRRCVLDGVAEKRIEFSKVLDTWQLANFSL